MGDVQHDTGGRFVRLLFDVGTLGGLTDRQLLERFTAEDGEASELAFATLVQRHGPMVLGVCGSLLRDPHEADDAFQATFLVLVRRARSLWVRDSLGPWLYQVAYRVASSAVSAAGRRRGHERRAAERARVDVTETGRDDLGDVLHDEVNRLPSGFRAAVVLCYFEGLSPEQAARQLGCPVGTVQSRLARGRERLRSRLTRRGHAPQLGAGLVAAGPPAAPSSTLVEATVRAALQPLTVPAGVSGSVVRLVRGVLRSMFFTKVGMLAGSLVTIAALAVGARTMMQDRPAPQQQGDLDQTRAGLGAKELAIQREALPETDPPPPDLAWNDVPQARRRPVIEQLAALSRGNYEKIKTWKGSYAYIQRGYLDAQSVTQLLAGARSRESAPAAPQKAEPLIQEHDSVLTFAIDTGADAIYREVRSNRLRYLEVATEKAIEVPNVGTGDHRSILTPNAYFYFNPHERATSAFLPGHPQAQNKRRVERFDVKEASMREGGAVDPRAFFKFDTGNSFWTGLELYAQAMRGDLGAEQKKMIEERLKLTQADGPGGTWYRDQMGFGNPGGRMYWVTTLWSPQAGFNPVRMVGTLDTSDGKLETKIEWQWKVTGGIYVPSTINETAYRGKGDRLSKQQRTALQGCVLNQPLGLHQFDEGGLGVSDGDLVLDHLERVAYIINGGEPVKLANFGEGSILAPPAAKPAATTETGTTRPRRPSKGRIYTMASLETDRRGMPVSSLIAVDPASGDVTKVFDGYPGRLRVAPDGRKAAFVSGEWWSNLPRLERMRKSLWIRAFGAGEKPERLVRLDGSVESGGELPVWSADCKQLIIGLSHHDDSRKQWVFATCRINADGSGRQPLAIPDQDGVQDWSADGAWVVTASSRNAKIGWQLYLMRPDGKDQRQVTEGGNPFYTRFSPDSKRLLYTDGPQADRLGIWVVDLDGKNRQRLLATGRGTASACWSPDGGRIAVAIKGSKPEEKGRLEVLELDGTHRTLLTMPGQEIADMPDWR
jgi:RNA polymerase sigma factor (sigma-70 family)